VPVGLHAMRRSLLRATEPLHTHASTCACERTHVRVVRARSGFMPVRAMRCKLARRVVLRAVRRAWARTVDYAEYECAARVLRTPCAMSGAVHLTHTRSRARTHTRDRTRARAHTHAYTHTHAHTPMRARARARCKQTMSCTTKSARRSTPRRRCTWRARRGC
jgi:hypothetical protein